MARSTKLKGDAKKRDGSRFAAVPFVVLERDAYVGLSGSAVRLLMEFARQINGSNNGNLYCPWEQMAQRGRRSQTTLKAAKDELVLADFLCEARKGARPNRATWYGLTWRVLDITEELDIAPSAFPRSAYMRLSVVAPRRAGARATQASAKIIRLIPVSGAIQAVFGRLLLHFLECN